MIELQSMCVCVIKSVVFLLKISVSVRPNSEFKDRIPVRYLFFCESQKKRVETAMVGIQTGSSIGKALGERLFSRFALFMFLQIQIINIKN